MWPSSTRNRPDEGAGVRKQEARAESLDGRIIREARGKGQVNAVNFLAAPPPGSSRWSEDWAEDGWPRPPLPNLRSTAPRTVEA